MREVDELLNRRNLVENFRSRSTNRYPIFFPQVRTSRTRPVSGQSARNRSSYAWRKPCGGRHQHRHQPRPNRVTLPSSKPHQQMHQVQTHLLQKESSRTVHFWPRKPWFSPLPGSPHSTRLDMFREKIYLFQQSPLYLWVLAICPSSVGSFSLVSPDFVVIFTRTRPNRPLIGSGRQSRTHFGSVM